MTNEIDRAWAALDAVTDPEIPIVTIRELGILRDVRAIGPEGDLEVIITPTYSGCPAMEQIESDVRAALSQAQIQAQITCQLAPAWTTDWMSEPARRKLREYGIAPPMHSSDLAVASVVQFATKKIAARTYPIRDDSIFHAENIPCPRCSSDNTTETSHFASTACKALYKCLDCLEPFDYFKPY